MNSADNKYDPDVLSRVRYYDGAFLKEDEFIDEQKYHIDRRHRHDRLLHVAGVCEGLEPQMVDDKTVCVGAGTAIDDQGRTILLAKAKDAKVEGAGTFWIVLVFKEVESRSADPKSAGPYTRFTQDPELKFSPDPVKHGVILGKIEIVNGKLSKVISSEGRTYSGLRLPGPEGTTHELRASSDGLVGLNCDLSIAGALSVTGATIVATLTTSGLAKLDAGLSVTGATKLAALTASGSTNLDAGLTVTGATKLVELSASGKAKLSDGLTVTGPTTLNGSLNVTDVTKLAALTASGATSLTAGLSVTGDISVAAKLRVEGKAYFSEGIVANGLTIGRNEGNIIYPYPYESIGTISEGHNLRLQSQRDVFIHTYKNPSVRITEDSLMLLCSQPYVAFDDKRDGRPPVDTEWKPSGKDAYKPASDFTSRFVETDDHWWRVIKTGFIFTWNGRTYEFVVDARKYKNQEMEVGDVLCKTDQNKCRIIPVGLMRIS